MHVLWTLTDFYIINTGVWEKPMQTIFFFSGVVRASSIFPILSAILLLLGGVCVASSRFYKTKRHIILGAGILFVVAGNMSYYNVQ